MAAATLPCALGQTSQTVVISSLVPGVLALGIDIGTVSINFVAADYNASTGAATKTVTSDKRVRQAVESKRLNSVPMAPSISRNA